VGELWQRHGCAVLLVTHDVDEALTLADRVLVMNNGRIDYDAPVELARPRETGKPAFQSLRTELLARLGVHAAPPENEERR
jgi:sulfonate transport system ATP-binding protein